MNLLNKANIKFKIVTKNPYQPKTKAKTQLLTPAAFSRWMDKDGRRCSWMDIGEMPYEEVVGYLLTVGPIDTLQEVQDPTTGYSEINHTITAVISPMA